MYDLLEMESFRKLRDEINIFTETLLAGYTENISDKAIHYSENKEIFDPIWGPVEFNAGEILLLDSPLIQRLRKIKQLGLASYVYCGADYSRFAHTIGVFWLAGEMAEIISKQLPEHRKNKKYNCVQIVKLAAIFHDAGHMYFSHASERYFMENTKYSRFENIKEMIKDFSAAIDDNVSLHELIGIMIVNSHSVKELLFKIAPALSLEQSEECITEITESISCLILGQANNESLLPYHQIINGSLDADKCDYLARDSHATNVPVAVDIFRLIHKLSINEDKYPEELPNTKLWEESRNLKVFYPTIKSSAIEALNQLIMARSIMYNSVYYHQKVRTAETMFERILEELDNIGVTAVIDFTQVMLMTDDVFGHYCYSVLANNQSGVNASKLKEATEKLNKINCRILMKRACSIDMDNIVMLSDEKKYRIEQDIFMLGDSNKIKEVEQETKKQFEEICRILNVSEKPNRTFMIMEFPKVRSGDSFPNIYVSYGNGMVKSYSEIFQTGTWIESKESRNKEKYIVTDCENRDLVFLALQKALFTRYEAYLQDDAAICSKVAPKNIKERKRRLLAKGFYTDTMTLVSDIVLPDYEDQIKKICKKYQTFEGAKGKTIDEKNVTEFLLQFLQLKLSQDECNFLLDGILRILEQGIYINRHYFSKKMEEIFKQFLQSCTCIHVCPLGKETDSGVHMTYYLNDVKMDSVHIHMTLQKALKETSKGDFIILFDDGAYSGKQVSSIFEEYMGVPLEKRSIKESHVDPLNEEEKQQLRERHFCMAYICLNAENKATIIGAAKEVGIVINDIKFINDMEKKKFDMQASIFKNEEQRSLVERSLKEIGLQILNSVKKDNQTFKEGWSQERVEESALGYNNAQQFVVLQSGVPTYTIPAFWLENGIFNHNIWNPLFVRTDKQ